MKHIVHNQRVRGSVFVMLDQAVLSIAMFALTIVLTRYLSEEAYGTYRYINSVISILLLVSLVGLSTALVQAVAKGKERSIYLALKTRIMWGWLGSAIALLYAGFHYLRGEGSIALSIGLLALVVPFLDTFGLYAHYLYAKGKNKLAAQMGVCINVSTLIVVAFVAYLTHSFVYAVLTYFFVQLIQRSLALWLALKWVQPEGGVDESIVPFGKSLSITQGLDYLLTHVDKAIIFFMLGPVATSHFVLCIIFIEQIREVSRSFSQFVFVPMFSVHKESAARDAQRQLYRYGVPLVVFGYGVYLLVLPYVFKYAFPVYTEIQWLSSVYGMAIFAILGYIQISRFQAEKRVQALYVSSVGSSILYTILVALGAYYGGLVYAVYGAIIGRLAIIPITYIVSRYR